MSDNAGYSGELFNKTIHLPGGGIADAIVDWSDLQIVEEDLLQDAVVVQENAVRDEVE